MQRAKPNLVILNQEMREAHIPASWPRPLVSSLVQSLLLLSPPLRFTGVIFQSQPWGKQCVDWFNSWRHRQVRNLVLRCFNWRIIVMLCQCLPSNSMDQPYVYIHPSLLSFPPTPLHLLGSHRAPGWSSLRHSCLPLIYDYVNIQLNFHNVMGTQQMKGICSVTSRFRSALCVEFNKLNSLYFSITAPFQVKKYK